MSSLVKLSSKLPDDLDINGLDPWASVFKQRPLDQFVAVVYLDVARVVTDYEKGSVYPVVQVVSIEVLGDIASTSPDVQAQFLAARDKRLRRDPLPLNDWTLRAGTGVLKERMIEAPCDTCNHPAGDHDIDTGQCTITNCTCEDPVFTINQDTGEIS